MSEGNCERCDRPKEEHPGARKGFTEYDLLGCPGPLVDWRARALGAESGRAFWQQVVGTTDLRKAALAAALAEVLEWIKCWSPEFTEDDDWPATDERAHDALAGGTAALDRMLAEARAQTALLFYAEACPGWETDGRVEFMLENVRRFREAEVEKARAEGFRAGVEAAADYVTAEVEEARKAQSLLAERDKAPTQGFAGPVVRESDTSRQMRRIVEEANARAAAIRALLDGTK